jgi:uncharacterized membrane protein YqjE
VALVSTGGTGPGAAAPGGIVQSLRNLAATALQIVQTRLELLATELEEERLRLLQIVFWGMAALFFLVFALGMLTLLLIAAFWDTHRVAVIAWLGVLYFVLGAAAALYVRSMISTRRGLFSTSIGELRKDRDELTPP